MGYPENSQLVLVEIRTTVTVELPEAKICNTIADKNGEMLLYTRRRAINAAISAFPERVLVLIDGKERLSATVYFDVSDNNVEDITVE